MDTADTIAAIATAAGAGGIGVVRVSGPATGAIARTVLGQPPQPRHAHLCAFHDAGGAVIDRGLLLWFPAPHSFTGEDVLELHAHGSPVALGLLRQRLFELGARPARPGEFSERAFLNGKLDLAQAEAVADLIASGSEAAARAAMRSLDGAFSAEVHALNDDVVRLRSHLEAAIDFADEDIDFLAAPEVLRDLDALGSKLAHLQAGAARGARLVDGLHAVIIGRPNTGKSSLLNQLAGSERAIVTATAGTTRDVLRETVSIDGIALGLVDTAGLREAGDPVEQEGVRRARLELARADVVLLVTDAPDDAADLALAEGLPDGAQCLVIHNKIDLHAASPARRRIGPNTHLWLSARSGQGLDLLRDELHRLGGGTGAEGTFSARSRHLAALAAAADALDSARRALVDARAGELAVEDLRQVQQALGEITGQFTTDDLLGAIFSRFCIGK
jgi:tRNA modification GTPase